jgi:hypothetical protein
MGFDAGRSPSRLRIFNKPLPYRSDLNLIAEESSGLF